MVDIYLAEIRAFPFNFAPLGWAPCDGQLLKILENTALFSLLGTTYGGDGMSTFGLPDLRGRAAMSWGQGHGLSDRELGEHGGEIAVTLLETELPQHTHALNVSSDLAKERQPPGQVFAQGDGVAVFGPNNVTPAPFAPGAITYDGHSTPHNNLMPYLALKYCIAVQGLYPPRD